jgi:hypothetical protein
MSFAQTLAIFERLQKGLRRMRNGAASVFRIHLRVRCTKYSRMTGLNQYHVDPLQSRLGISIVEDRGIGNAAVYYPSALSERQNRTRDAHSADHLGVFMSVILIK